jgi:hypothetical protein
VARRAIPAMAIVGPGIRSQQRVMVPIFSRMAPHQALVDSFPLELSMELSQSDASEYIPLATRWRCCAVPPVNGTS